MAELKTKQTDASVEAFINSVENETRRSDAFKILEIMTEVSQSEAKMWGPSIIGFGNYKYKYPNGKEMDWMEVAFSPRKQNLVFYIADGFDNFERLVGQLGKVKTSKACIYANKLSDLNQSILRQLISESLEYIRKK
ncbi:MAG: DUF1801 domain-containing protein [Spirosomaceae bacterium]|jgi:hypothetical protein|nr:DUF1801 domain-containing protein [Spirosomataceae bacterium]